MSEDDKESPSEIHTAKNSFKSPGVIAAIIVGLLGLSDVYIESLLTGKEALKVSKWKSFNPTWNISNHSFDIGYAKYREFGNELELDIKIRVKAKIDHKEIVKLHVPKEYVLNNDNYYSLIRGDVIWLNHNKSWFTFEAINQKHSGDLATENLIFFKTDSLPFKDKKKWELTYNKFNENDFLLIHIFIPIKE